MITRKFTLNYHIVDICFHISPNLGVEHPVHLSLVHGPYILKAEGHSDVAVGPDLGDEGGFFFIFGIHLDLVVSTEGDKEAK